MEKARAHLLIEGIVQGVFYRAYTRNIAAKLGLSGWVRNLYDGRVEAVFEGGRRVIELAVEECRRGPQGSRVTGIDIEWEEIREDLQGFEIRH